MAHILLHQEMVGMESEIERVLLSPAEVRVSRSDQTVELFYEYVRENARWWEMALCRGKVPVIRWVRGNGIPDRPTQSGRDNMAEKVKVWFDPEADYLEVQFREAPGFMRPTTHDAVMERVDDQGHVLGFSVLGVSRFRKDRPLEAELVAGD